MICKNSILASIRNDDLLDGTDVKLAGTEVEMNECFKFQE